MCCHDLNSTASCKNINLLSLDDIRNYQRKAIPIASIHVTSNDFQYRRNHRTNSRWYSFGSGYTIPSSIRTWERFWWQEWRLVDAKMAIRASEHC